MTQENRTRILAVEDNPDTQLLLRYLLKPHYELEIVPRVDEAVRVASENRYDVLLLDINLGEERTGIDLLRALREMPGYARTPALALTAYAMPGDRERFVSSGFDGYVSKPFTRKELFEAIRIVLEASGRG